MFKINFTISSFNSEEFSEYSEKIIKFKDKVLYLKEMQKDFLNYLNYPNSSIYFLLFDNLHFLILRKIFEEGDPDFTILLHQELLPRDRIT